MADMQICMVPDRANDRTGLALGKRHKRTLEPAKQA
jgi:hypothetical protein